MESRKKSVSVIIPTFNSGRFVADAIGSVLKQTLPPSEIIVVDDCSNDNTLEVIELLKLPLVKVIARTVNGGGGAARADGILAATSQYVAFLDSDDLWQPDKLELQLSEFEKLSEQTRRSAICYTNLSELDPSLGFNRNFRGLRPDEGVASYIFLHSQTIQTSTLLLERELAVFLSFDVRLRRHQDWDFVLRAEKNGAFFIYVDLPLVQFRQNVGNNRVSKQVSVEPSLYWLELQPGLIGGKARVAFYANEIVGRMFVDRPLRSISWVMVQTLLGRLGLLRGMKLIAKGILPDSILSHFRSR